MALNPKAAVATRNAAIDAACARANNGFLDIYDGAQPATADTAVTTQVKLARLAMSATAFAAASNGAAVANAITSSAALADGTPTWYRLVTSADAPVIDGSVGTASSNLVLNSATIVAGATVSVTSFTVTQAA